MTASEAFVETLAAQGVTDVFGIVGSAFMDALDLFPDAGKFLSKKAKNLFFSLPRNNTTSGKIDILLLMVEKSLTQKIIVRNSVY